ncbi:hypothetical protein ACIBI9_12110 [Nonomuraea sp. NPDC050451]|uniref:hypothetical protein n=1 Tax=Nonomuraea sp. NPDC050451 TaxID=3364364 RepID=UPI0037B4C86B
MYASALQFLIPRPLRRLLRQAPLSRPARFAPLDRVPTDWAAPENCGLTRLPAAPEAACQQAHQELDWPLRRLATASRTSWR